MEWRGPEESFFFLLTSLHVGFIGCKEPREGFSFLRVEYFGLQGPEESFLFWIISSPVYERSSVFPNRFSLFEWFYVWHNDQITSIQSLRESGWKLFVRSIDNLKKSYFQCAWVHWFYDWDWLVFPLYVQQMKTMRHSCLHLGICSFV